MSVSRETLVQHSLSNRQLRAFDRLLAALAAEPDPPTTVRRPQHAAAVHLADSLAALQVDALRHALSVADIGAGAGFPGLPLAIALPRARVDLLEATRRKCMVIERLAAAADLTNVRVLAIRAEQWAREEGACAYDAVTVRAVGPLPLLLEYAAPLLKQGGSLIAWKGRRDPAEEEQALRAAATLGMLPCLVASTTPYEGSENHNLHVYLKVSETPSRFPRRIGVAAKRPLGRRS